MLSSSSLHQYCLEVLWEAMWLGPTLRAVECRGGAGLEDFHCHKVSGEVEVASRTLTLWEALDQMKRLAQTILFLGALWGSWLNTDSDSAWIWAWESAFFLNVFQVISALGSIDQPLIRDDEAWEIEIYRYVSPIQLRCPVSSFILVNL